METDRRERFEDLVAEVHDPLWRYLARRVPRHDVDDVMNDVLTTIWRRLDVVPRSTPLPWCYGVARRTMANHRRGQRRLVALAARLESHPHALRGGHEPEHTVLLDVIDALPAQDQELIRLWAWEGLEPREIAVVLQTTPNAVSVRLTRIKSRLRKELERKDSPDAGHKTGENTGDRT